jgi:hypothetical protein
MLAPKSSSSSALVELVRITAGDGDSFSRDPPKGQLLPGIILTGSGKKELGAPRKLELDACDISLEEFGDRNMLEMTSPC